MSEKKSVIRETDDEAVRLARTLMRTARYGALAVIDPADGTPFASRIAIATDTDGTPLTLISRLSTHTGALLEDGRCSLLLGEPGKGDPLAYPRISLSCRARALPANAPETGHARFRYFNRHPKARLYAGFADFSFFRLEIARASLNGGFGKAYHLKRSDMIVEGEHLETFAAGERSALDHMNADHADAVGIYAAKLAGARGGTWTMAALDPEGFEIVCGDEVKRIFFPRRARDMRDLRALLVELATDGPKNGD
jgi:heme oxygenase (biliverdin-IX-beta and delta-forming)